MKKIFFTLALVVIVSFSGSHKAHAAGLPVFDGANFGQFTVNNIKGAITAGASVLGGTNQALQTFNENVLYPLQDLATIKLLFSSKKFMLAYVGGQAGIDPKFINNPQRYLRNRANVEINIVLKDPQLQATMANGTVAKTLIANAKYESLTLNEKIKAINQSSVPQQEQQQRCTDQALSYQARQDVSDSKGNYNQADYSARKREIYNALCGDINNPRTQAALTAVSKANPVDPLGELLATTQGKNQWYRELQTQQAINKRIADVVENEKKTLDNNGSIKNETKCLEYAIPGNKESGCKEGKEIILQSADNTNNAFKGALDSDTKSALSSIGNKVGGILGTFIATKSALNTLTGGLGGGNSGGGSSGSDIFVGGSNTVTTVASTPSNDLIGNTAAKNSIIAAPKEHLINHKNSLTRLISMDTKYLATIEQEQSDLDSMKSCYNSVISQHQEAASDSRVLIMDDFYRQRMSKNSELQTTITNEKQAAQNGLTLVDSTITKISASQSSGEITDVFLAYQNKIKADGIPEETAAIVREGDYYKYEQEVTMSEKEDGDIYKYNATCSQMQQEYTTRRGSGM